MVVIEVLFVGWWCSWQTSEKAVEKKRIDVNLPASVRMRESSLKLGAEMGAGGVLCTFRISKYSFNEVFIGEPKNVVGHTYPVAVFLVQLPAFSLCSLGLLTT